MLKFENTAQIGDMIKGLDFKPMPGRPDYFITGIVLDKGPIIQEIEPGVTVNAGRGYKVRVVGADEERKAMGIVGEIMYIPFEVSLMEYDERVQLVATKEEIDIVLTGKVEIH